MVGSVASRIRYLVGWVNLTAADFWKLSAKLSCLFVVTEEDVLRVDKEFRLWLSPRWMVARSRMT